MEEMRITSPAIRLKVTGACNRSCFFCNKEGDMRGISNVEPNKELFECLDVLAGSLGISRVILTGGEPLMHPQLPEIVSGIRLPDISLTTNGILLKSSREWLLLQGLGLSKVTISICEVSPERFLRAETRQNSLEWALKSLRNQTKNLINASEAGVSTRVNVVAYGGYEETREVLSFLRSLQIAYGFEVRILNDLASIESSQKVISQICAKLDARVLYGYRRAGSSNVTRYYRAQDGFEFSVKVSFPYFFAPVCENCLIRRQGKCFEGFYGMRLERREESYYVRLCLYKQSPDVLLPWEEFIDAEVAQELKNTS